VVDACLIFNDFITHRSSGAHDKVKNSANELLQVLATCFESRMPDHVLELVAMLPTKSIRMECVQVILFQMILLP
jgi:hypothetical protein